jgi:glucose/arabinose dehydrogenase
VQQSFFSATARGRTRALAGLFLLATGGMLTVAARRVETRPNAACDGDNAGLTLPPGFCASVFADGLGGVRHMTVAPNGDVLVVRQNRAPQDSLQGGVVVLGDANNDGKAEVKGTFGPVGGTGIALHGNQLYVDARSAILRYAYPVGTVTPSAQPDTIVKALPTRGHAARNFVLDDAGNLYVNVGSNTNSCQEKERENLSKGVDPCVELETRAGIWKFSATTLNQTFSPSARYATGIRNAVGLAWNAAEKQLYATQHGRDQLFQNWAPLYNEEASAEQPAEEFLKVNAGDDFGWPYCYYDSNLKRLVLAPEYGGNAKDAGRCAQKKGPLVHFPGHWAPNGLLFYTGRAFPARYRDGAFIAFHGSWNRAPREQAGYKVVFVPANKGAFGGAYETFADKFALTLDPSKAEHRPTGLAVANDGALLVSDDKGGRIYRITYSGTK